MQLTTWIPLRYWRIWGGGNFIDSGQILQWADCYKNFGSTIFLSQGECSGYLYGSSLIRILNALNLAPSNTQLLGYMFMFCLALAIAYSAGFSRDRTGYPLLLAVLCSPPILLLAERGNFDIPMLLLVIFTSILFSRRYQAWALIPLSVSVLLKFYTLPLFILYFVLNDTKRRKLFTLIVGVIVSVQVALDLRLVQSTFPSGFSWKFGSSIWARYLSQLDSAVYGEVFAHLSGLGILLIFLLLTMIAMKKSRVLQPSKICKEGNGNTLFYSLFGTHLSCFMLGVSFDYRLVFLLLASLVYLKLLSERSDAHAFLIIGLTIMSAWLTYPSSGLEPLGDLATEALTVILGIQMVKLMKYDLKSRNAK
jgi:hypothetical protein